MKAEKLPSGSYRYRKMYKGKAYTVVLPNEVKEKELMLIFADKIKEDADNNQDIKGTFKYYAKKYIESRSNVLSQASIRTYNIKINQLSDNFNAMKIKEITNDDVQIEINSFALKHAPKTTKTLYGFIASVMAVYRPSMQLRITLPMNKQTTLYEPNTKEIKAILDAVKGTRYSIPFQLGVLGLRRGEICALELSDLDGNKLHIHRDMVYNKKWIKDDKPKTEASNRVIYIPDALVEEIKAAGCIYDGHPNALNKAIHRIQKSLGINEFKFHSLRSYFASYSHSLGFSDQNLMAMGGWATDSILKKVYRKQMADQREQDLTNMANKILS